MTITDFLTIRDKALRPFITEGLCITDSRVQLHRGAPANRDGNTESCSAIGERVVHGGERTTTQFANNLCLRGSQSCGNTVYEASARMIHV